MLPTRYNYHQDFVKRTDGTSWSMKQIAFDVFTYFGEPKNHAGANRPVSPATIKKDMEIIRDRFESERDARLKGEHPDDILDPHNFATWRGNAFTDRTTGNKFVTPMHQMAWFWIIAAVALKNRHAVEIPQWVISYLDLPPDINSNILDMKTMMSFILLGPPRHGKTELALHTMMWLMCRDKGIRIIFNNGPLKTTKQQIEHMKWHLEHNEYLIAGWGPFKDDEVKWAQDEFDIVGAEVQAKARTVRGVGTGTNVNSLDADVIFVDDPQGPKEAMSETQTDSDYHWMATGLMSRREPHTGFIGLGSHQPSPTGDLWTKIESAAEELTIGNHVLVIRKVKAHDYNLCDEDKDPDHTECVLWHELRPFHYLEALRALLGDDTLFEAVYNQQPRSKEMEHFPTEILDSTYTQPQTVNGTTPVYTGHDIGSGMVEFLPGVLDRSRAWKRIPVKCCSTPLMVVAGVDPAGGGKTKRASFTAVIVLAACPKCRRRYLVDYGAKRMSPEQIPLFVEGFLKSYPAVTRIQFESNAYQKALSRDPRVKAMGMKYRVTIAEWNTDERKHDPDLGIPVLGRYVKAGMLSIPAAGVESVVYAKNLIATLKRWPAPPNDIAMALWLADLLLMKMIDNYWFQQEAPDVMPGHHISEHGKQSYIEIPLAPAEEYQGVEIAFQ